MARADAEAALKAIRALEVAPPVRENSARSLLNYLARGSARPAIGVRCPI